MDKAAAPRAEVHPQPDAQRRRNGGSFVHAASYAFSAVLVNVTARGNRVLSALWFALSLSLIHIYECGLSFEKYNDIKVGDIVEAYVMEQIEQ